MQDDPDLRPIGIQPQEVYFNGTTTQGAGGFLAGVVNNKPIIFIALVLTLLNVLFLIVQTVYSYGLFGKEQLSFDGSSYFATVIMVLIAGTFGFISSVIGFHLSRAHGSMKMVAVNRILLVAIVILSALVLLAPVIDRTSGV